MMNHCGGLLFIIIISVFKLVSANWTVANALTIAVAMIWEIDVENDNDSFVQTLSLWKFSRTLSNNDDVSVLKIQNE